MNGISHPLALAESRADTLARSRMLICPKCRTTYSSTALASCYRDGERLVDYDRFVAVERDPLRGTLVGGKYRLVERVGQGGMGTVYRAVQTGLNRAVAVKILKRELNIEPDTVARFHREANAMSLLTHPNTVRVYDFGQTEDGLFYLVMELLEGELITERMAREAPLDVLDALRTTQQILRSLAEAHKKAIVHRDLKPDNVFVARVAGHPEPVIKVLDFGIAKVVAPDRRVDQFETQAGTVFGTPRYMSPEQAQGAALDGRSDLYSVGTLLYQMLTGRAPFTDDDAVVVMAKHIREMPVAPNVAAPERPIPKSLNDVVMRALVKDPASRFQEASEFELALEGCVPEVISAQARVLTGRWSHGPSPRSRALYIACALALFGVGYFGVRVYAKLHNPEGEQLSSAPIAPNEAPVVLSARSSESAAPEQGPPAPTPEIANATAEEAPREAAPAPEAPTAERAAARAVAIAVRSSPQRAAVYRDGKRLGETPLNVRLKPEERAVRVELRHAGYKPLPALLNAEDGARSFTLVPAGKAKRPKRAAGESSGRALDESVKPESEPTPSEAPPPAPAAKPADNEPYERFE